MKELWSKTHYDKNCKALIRLPWLIATAEGDRER